MVEATACLCLASLALNVILAYALRELSLRTKRNVDAINGEIRRIVGSIRDGAK